MAKLAIKGHKYRGNEVIEILEMLGGKNIYKLGGETDLWYILSNSTIEHATYCFQERSYTLEEFLEKFPYKVGDKILYKTYGIYAKIKTMLWNVEKEQVFYRLESNKLFVATADELKPYKKEVMEEIKVDIPKGYEFAGVDDNAQQVVFTKIGYHYPRTYEECCKILGVPSSFELRNQTIQAWYIVRLSFFQQLLICRDAYWEIGEQMGLHKPWKPDWENFDSMKYCIGTDKRIVGRCIRTTNNKILAFPTEEMRDAFYKNFKELIEECKELL